MGHRGRSLRSDMEMSSAQNHGKGLAQYSSTVGVHPPRHFRQFSTRSRTKSTASFKGLHRIITNDGCTEAENSSLHGNGFKKSKSSDSLYRKRALSGLNMTTLARVKSNPAQSNAWKTGSDTSPNSFSMGQSMGIKPSRSKSTHSVVDLRDGNELYDNESTTDEEVEYFTDEDEDDEHNINNKSTDVEEIGTKDSLEVNNGIGEKDHSWAQDHTHSVLISKTLSDLTLQFKEKDNDNRPISQPSYKVPSDLIKQRSQSDELIAKEKMKYQNQRNVNSLIQDNDDRLRTIENGDDDISNNVNGSSGSSEVDDGDDHISHPDLSAFDSNNNIETIAHSLTRQLNNHNDSTLENMISNSNEITVSNQVDNTGGNYDEQKESIHSNNEDYIPDMILSQSTGMERRFEQPPSIQNSLADDYPIKSMNQNKQELPVYNNFKSMAHEKDSMANEEPRFPQQNIAKETSRSTQPNFSNAISGLTTSLQGSGPESFYGSARMDNFLQKRASQNSMLRSDLRSLLSSERPHSSLHREQSPPSSNINNFAQFLKSDGLDGESRTQRKLWLQRENSIMDLSAQNEATDTIFMASNVEVKREFERISHEYTNVRRFSNPVEEALARVDKKQKNIGIKSSKKMSSDISDVLFPNYGSKETKIDEFLPQTENTKLHRILSGIWKEESALFNKDTNPLNKQKTNSSNHFILQPNRNTLRNTMGPSTGLHHQRMVNSLQPTTRAVHRRMENNIHQQQRT